MRASIDPYTNGLAVTKSDATVLQPTKALFVGGAGNLTVDFAGVGGATDVLITAPIVGQVLPISVIRVKAATTATAIVALY